MKSAEVDVAPQKSCVKFLSVLKRFLAISALNS